MYNKIETCTALYLSLQATLIHNQGFGACCGVNSNIVIITMFTSYIDLPFICRSPFPLIPPSISCFLLAIDSHPPMHFLSACCCANDAGVVPQPIQVKLKLKPPLSRPRFKRLWGMKSHRYMIQQMTRYPHYHYNPRCFIGGGIWTCV